MDQIHTLGSLALGSRLKRLSDRFMAEAATIYAAQSLPFEPRWFPLFSLLADQGPLAMGEAAQALGVTHAAVSQTARGMIRKKIIAATKDASDERRTKIALTKQGRELVERLRPLWQDIRAAVDEVTAATGVDLLSTLSRLERAMDDESIAARTARHRLSSVRIRDYEPALKAAFRELNVEWIKQYFALEEADLELFDDPQKHVLDGGGHILFAEADDDVVGTCALVKRAPYVFELVKMAVAPRAQGKQIGKKLMLAALDRARGCHAKRVYLETNDSLTPAVNLYRSVGFVPVPQPESSKYARVNLIMEKNI